MRWLRPLLYIVLTIPAPALVAADGPSTRVSHVWIREAPPGINVLAGYFTLENLTGKTLTLDEVTSPDFGKVEIHQSVQKDGTESMQQLDSLEIPAHGNVEFRPGGYHLMLMQPHKNLFSGDTVSLILSFSDGSQLAILAPVRHDAPLH
jgi:copper(I)-binding protein